MNEDDENEKKKSDMMESEPRKSLATCMKKKLARSSVFLDGLLHAHQSIQQ
jgi:hypothetical protein